MGYLVVTFGVEVDDIQFSRVFDTFDMEITDMRPVWDQLEHDFIQTQLNVFSMEGAVDNRARWQPLSPMYAAWKQRVYGNLSILQLTRRMMRSLTEPNHPDMVLVKERDAFVIGTRVPYAIFHQKGTRKMPQRKVIELTELQKRRWVSIIHRYLYSLAERRFGPNVGRAPWELPGG